MKNTKEISGSKWWYIIGIVVISTVIILIYNTIRPYKNIQVMNDITGILFILLVLTFPVLGVSFYFDSKTIQKSSSPWNPNPYLFYAFIGILQLGILIEESLAIVTMMVSIFYLYQRHRFVGIP